MIRLAILRFTNWRIGTKVSEEDPNYKEVQEIYSRQSWDEINSQRTFKPRDTGFAALSDQYEAICRTIDNKMGNVSSTFDKEFKNLANGADMFKDCWALSSTQSAVSSCCTTSNQISQNYNNSCCSIRSNAASIREVEEVQKNINELNFEVNKKFDKMQEEISEKLNWQAICLYLTWAMIIVIGFMIYFKSFDVSVEVNNPIPNQEVILEHE